MQSAIHRIVGQGLVGSLLAHYLHERGQAFVVQASSLEGECTRIAPGIVNPLAGRRFLPPDNVVALLAALKRAVERCHALTGSDIWHPLPIVRMFADPAQAERFAKETRAGSREGFIGKILPPDHFAFLNDDFGSVETLQGGWADLQALQAATRQWLIETDRFIDSPFAPDMKSSHTSERLIFCEGWRASENPLWKFIPHNPAKGEMLIVRFAEPLPREGIYNHYCWAQPYMDDLWRVGATYSWSDFDNTPSVKGIQDLRERVELLTPIPFTIVDQVAGVRPIVEDYAPVLGQHPQLPHCYILNAMGSKGVMQAPYAIELFAAHLLHAEPVPRNWSLERFLP